MTERKNFDSEFCGSLPLHNVNLIQDYGYLLVLDLVSLNILQASENIIDLTGKPVQELVNSNISALVEHSDIEKIRENLKGGIKQRIPFDVHVSGEAGSLLCHALMHIKDSYAVIELEKSGSQGSRTFAAVFQEVKKVMAAIDQAENVQSVCDIAVRELRKISGFDGVLMYRFDADWNGTVIAEEKAAELDPYLGQTFPASDIPRQARQLYLKNPYRLIPNRDFQPVRLYPVINPVTNTFIDLSDCNLRSVPAVHLEYMKNMGIKASMSIRVIKSGQLWGLISCHHIEEKYLDYEVCSVFEWLSAVISAAISRILDKEAYEIFAGLQQKRAWLTDRIYEEGDIISGLFKPDDVNILDLFNAGGAVAVVSGRLESIGTVPDADFIDNLTLWLEGKNIHTTFASDHFSGLYDDAMAFSDIGSGVLVIPVDAMKGDYMICFRPEVVQTINWGGDPNQAINFEDDGVKYHPRSSFKQWQQQVRGYAQPFSQAELDVAEALRSFLFEFRTKQLYNS